MNQKLNSVQFFVKTLIRYRYRDVSNIFLTIFTKVFVDFPSRGNYIFYRKKFTPHPLFFGNHIFLKASKNPDHNVCHFFSGLLRKRLLPLEHCINKIKRNFGSQDGSAPPSGITVLAVLTSELGPAQFFSKWSLFCYLLRNKTLPTITHAIYEIKINHFVEINIKDIMILSGTLRNRKKNRYLYYRGGPGADQPEGQPALSPHLGPYFPPGTWARVPTHSGTRHSQI